MEPFSIPELNIDNIPATTLDVSRGAAECCLDEECQKSGCPNEEETEIQFFVRVSHILENTKSSP